MYISEKTANIFKVIFIMIFLAAICVSCSTPFLKVSNRQNITATVTEKTVKRYNDKDKYIVMTELEDGSTMVLEVTDALFAGQFDSSDVYAGIKVGNTYKFDVGGYRIPLLSMYQNIYGYEETNN